MLKKILYFSLITACVSMVPFLFKSAKLKWQKSIQVYAQTDPYAQVKETINQLPANSGAYVVFEDGQTISKKSGEQFSSYSVIKLWIAAAVFANAPDNQVDSDTLSLIQQMLVSSDNNAANQLLKSLGDCSNGRCDDKIMQFAAENGYNRTYIRRRMLVTATSPENDNITSPQDAVSFMQNLLAGNIVNADVSEKIKTILQTRSSAKTDPYFKDPNEVLAGGFIGKSGILNDGRNNVGTFLDSNGKRVFFAFFIPTGGSEAERVITNLEKQLYDSSGQTSASGTTPSQSLGISACKFYRPDQTPGSALCVPQSEGFRCEEGLTYSSPYLISIFEEAAQKSGVPASVLAGIARFESTVPLQVSSTGKSYSLLDYTDDDVKAMESYSSRATYDNIDETIGSSSKALCPRSITGALGIVQVQPPVYIINEFEQRNILRLPGEGSDQNKINAATGRSAYSDPGMVIGAKFIGVSPDQIDLSYYCNPRTALLLGAGVMIYKANLGKGGADTWSPPQDASSYQKYIKDMAAGYYGADANTNQYVEGLWKSVSECKGSGTTSTTGGSSVSSKKARWCTKVGDPTTPNPCLSSGGGTTTGPAPAVDGSLLKQTIKDQFGVDMQGDWGEQALRWVYEKFYSLKQTNPKFIDYINGHPVVLIANAGDANAFDNVVKVGQNYADGQKFLGTLIHEFGHIIYWTKDPGVNLRFKEAELFQSPGPVTSYGAGNETENYPEMISYCLTQRPVGALSSQERWDQFYKPLAESIVGPCL